MRQNFHPQVMIKAWARCNGRCQHCGPDSEMLKPGNIFYDHKISDALGGQPTLENCQVLCRNHHDKKTLEQDRPAIDKTRRIRRRQAGIRSRVRVGRPMPGTKASGIRRRMDGTVEPWDVQLFVKEDTDA